MKKIILLTLIILMTVGCGKDVAYRTEGMQISIIDSCEYIKCYTYGIGAYTYSHKGNCRFCKERDSIKWKKHRKELETLVTKLKEK